MIVAVGNSILTMLTERKVARMNAGAVDETRSRVLETAAKLFTERGVAGTTVRMIADELGIAKSAVHDHFKTKDAIVEATLEPVLTELCAVVDEASRQQTQDAQTGSALDGFVELIVRHRSIIGLINRDPGIMSAAGRAARRPTISEARAKLTALLVGPEHTPTDRITVHILFRELAMEGGDPGFAALDDATLRRHLHDMGLRLLGLGT